MQQVSPAQETMALFDTKHYINIIFKVSNFHLAMFFFPMARYMAYINMEEREL